MTSTTPTLQAWARKPIGKVARFFVAVVGMTFATLVLMNAAVVDTGSWSLVLLGVAMAATAVRAASHPSLGRIAALGAIVVAIPLSLQVF